MLCGGCQHVLLVRTAHTMVMPPGRDPATGTRWVGVVEIRLGWPSPSVQCTTHSGSSSLPGSSCRYFPPSVFCQLHRTRCRVRGRLAPHSPSPNRQMGVVRPDSQADWVDRA